VPIQEGDFAAANRLRILGKLNTFQVRDRSATGQNKSVTK